MELYYIQVGGSDKSPDIVFWDENIKTKDDGVIACLAFFYRKGDAKMYLRHIEKSNEFSTKYEIKSLKI